MVDAGKNVAIQLKKYELCSLCLSRQANVSSKKPSEKCYICRGLMRDLDHISNLVLKATKPYEFNTFLIGASLPTQLYEREDALRARIKIRGRESIKSQLTRELGLRLSKMTKKKVEYLKPDLIINVLVEKDNSAGAFARSKSLTLQGLYIKRQRGFAQRQGKCPMCEGKGCVPCSYSGLIGFESIEGIISKHLMTVTKGQAPKFSWVGSEDQDSLVLGTGRPFYARISDPKIRRPKKLNFKESGVEVKIDAILDDLPDTQARFTVKTRIVGKGDRPITSEDVKKLRSLSGVEVKFESRAKMATKRIHSAQAKKTGENEFALTIVADGGLQIKQFVGGEDYMEPNISKLLGVKCSCIAFDILAVDVQ